MKKIFLTVSLFFSFLSSPHASLFSFSGLYVGGIAATSNTRLEETILKASQNLNTQSLGANLGFGIQMPLIGLYAGADLSILFKTSSDAKSIPFLNARLEEKSLFAIMGQLGWGIGPIMPYLEAGLQETTLEFKSALGKETKKISPFAFGVGIKGKVGPVLLSLGYRRAISTFSALGNGDLKLKQNHVLMNVAYHF